MTYDSAALQPITMIAVQQVGKLMGYHGIDSVAAPVEKENVLAMLEIQTVEDVHELAGDENVDKWRGAMV